MYLSPRHRIWHIERHCKTVTNGFKYLIIALLVFIIILARSYTVYSTQVTMPCPAHTADGSVKTEYVSLAPSFQNHLLPGMQ